MILQVTMVIMVVYIVVGPMIFIIDRLTKKLSVATEGWVNTGIWIAVIFLFTQIVSPLLKNFLVSYVEVSLEAIRTGYLLSAGIALVLGVVIRRLS